MNMTAMAAQPEGADRSWNRIVCDVLKRHEVRLATYVPDNVLTPLIRDINADSWFTSFSATREEEAVGIVSGSVMAGMRGIVLMQTSGFATLANTLASLPMVFQIPVVLMVSERGTLGEFNIGQQLVARTMRPVLDTLGIAHHTLTDEATMPFIVDRSIKQAITTQAPVAFILSPLLTGGNPVAHAKLSA